MCWSNTAYLVFAGFDVSLTACHGRYELKQNIYISQKGCSLGHVTPSKLAMPWARFQNKSSSRHQMLYTLSGYSMHNASRPSHCHKIEETNVIDAGLACNQQQWNPFPSHDTVTV